MAFSELLTLPAIRSWAGTRAYRRGEGYYNAGHVNGLKTSKGRISATVQGTYPYRVVLRDEGESIVHACDCPVGLGGNFCKHCVATALAWLEQQTPAEKKGRDWRRPTGKTGAGMTQKDVRAWLLLQEKESLADLLIEAAASDEHLYSHLLLKAASAGGVDLATYRKAIDQATAGGGFIDYHQMYDFWRGVDATIDAIAELLTQQQPTAVIELSEYALERVERALDYVDDSDGYMSQLLGRLQGLHLDACRRARPDPVALAERLFRWELQGEWDIFIDSVKTYAKVLGKRGKQRYRELAEAEWAEIRPLQPGEEDPNYYGRRFRITRIMENLAGLDGDIEALVQIKRHDLSTSRGFLEIAQLYSQARQNDKALKWAERGIRAFGEGAGRGLQDFLAGLYHRRKRHAEAMDLIWPQFAKNPCLAMYQHLKQHAERGKCWPPWRERALKHIRTEIAAVAQRNSRAQRRYGILNDRSMLVEIYLWEKDPESAWQEAQQGGCDERLWIRLAGLREDRHPRDAIAVYQQLIGPIVNRTNNDAYAEATGLLRRIRQLSSRLDAEDEYRQYLDGIRVEYRRKRNFMKLLDAL